MKTITTLQVDNPTALKLVRELISILDQAEVKYYFTDIHAFDTNEDEGIFSGMNETLNRARVVEHELIELVLLETKQLLTA